MSELKTPSGPCRELFWHELTPDRKVEKLADAVQYLTGKLKEALERLDQLKHHSHSEGQIVVPMRDLEHGYPAGSAASYFFRNPLGVEHL